MLAYYLEWHLRQRLAPILFDDHQHSKAAATRSSIVAPAQRSQAARRKAASKHTDDGLPVHSFRALLGELGTFTRNTMALASAPKDHFLLYPQLTPTQARTFELLGVTPRPSAVNHPANPRNQRRNSQLRPTKKATSA